MSRGAYSVGVVAVTMLCLAFSAGAATSALRTQPDAQFAGSFASSGTLAVERRHRR